MSIFRRKTKRSNRQLRKQPKRARRKVESRVKWHERLKKKLTKPEQTRVAERRREQRFAPMRARTATIRQIVGSPRMVSGLLLLMCTLTIYRAITNQRFRLDNISVIGAEFLPHHTVVEASGLQNSHIFSAEPAAAIEKIEDLPGVNDARLVVQWPDTVSIRIDEDEPLIGWEEAGERYWVNDDGEIVWIVADNVDLLHVVANVPPAPAPTAIPTVDPTDENAEPAEVVLRPNTYMPFVPEEIRLGALSLQSEISRTQGVPLNILAYDIHGGLSYVDPGGWKAWAGANGEVPLMVTGGWRVFFGADADMATKVSMYNALMANLMERDIQPEYVNISNVDRPFYKPVFVPEPVEPETVTDEG